MDTAIAILKRSCDGYPDGGSRDTNHGHKDERPGVDHNIASLPLAGTGPVFGKKCGLPEIWKSKIELVHKQKRLLKRAFLFVLRFLFYHYYRSQLISILFLRNRCSCIKIQNNSFQCSI